jgi:hypothetical protein
MPKSKVILLILAITITVSGCSIIGGETSDQSSGDAISVDRFEVTPQQIYAGSDVSAVLQITNTGNTKAEINVGDQGTNILKSYTPDLLKIEDFSASSSNISKTKKEYHLRPDDSLSMSWDLHQFDESRVRFYADQQIDMAFQIPFDYSVESYQQFQVKEDRDVSDLENLASASSSGPMDIHIQMIGSSSEHGSPIFLSQDNVQVRIRFINNDVEEGDGVGLIEIENPEIRALGDDFSIPEDGCNTPDNIRVSGESSTTITCDLNIPDVESSSQGEIQVAADYTFTKTVSKDHITVQYRG